MSKIKDILYRFFINYNHLIKPEWCGCKKCNYAGLYEGLSLEELYQGKKNPAKNHNSNI
jgi:hypothetical protein